MWNGRSPRLFTKPVASVPSFSTITRSKATHSNATIAAQKTSGPVVERPGWRMPSAILAPAARASTPKRARTSPRAKARSGSAATAAAAYGPLSGPVSVAAMNPANPRTRNPVVAP